MGSDLKSSLTQITFLSVNCVFFCSSRSSRSNIVVVVAVVVLLEVVVVVVGEERPKLGKKAILGVCDPQKNSSFQSSTPIFGSTLGISSLLSSQTLFYH